MKWLKGCYYLGEKLLLFEPILIYKRKPSAHVCRKRLYRNHEYDSKKCLMLAILPFNFCTLIETCSYFFLLTLSDSGLTDEERGDENECKIEKLD